MRDKILKILEKNPGISAKLLCKKVTSKLKKDIIDEISSLEKDGLIIIKKDGCLRLTNDTDFFVTKINSNKENNPYINVFGVSSLIKKQNLKDAIVGDIVKVIKIKNEYVVSEIVNRKNVQFLVECHLINGVKYYKVLNHDAKLFISVVDDENIVDGDRLVLSPIDGKVTRKIQCKIERYVCNVKDPDVELKTMCGEYGFRVDFSEDTINELNDIKTKLDSSDYINRIDLTRDLVVTIDPVTAKDLDDAFSLEKTDYGYLLKTHIADVAAYVPLNSAIFNDALKNTTSLYLANSVIPMFPHKISSGTCSLLPGTEKLVRTTEIKLNHSGELLEFKLYKSIIKSSKQMDYDSVQKVFDNEPVDGYEEYENFLMIVKELAEKLNTQAEKRGMLNFGSDDICFKYNEQSSVIADAELEPGGLSHDFIANIMILSNSLKLKSFKELPAIYRVHEALSKEKIYHALNQLDDAALNLELIKKFKSDQNLQSIINSLSKEEASYIYLNVIKKSLERAYYSTENKGHFGLKLDVYGHTTSPIRRIPDYIIQVCEDVYEKKDESFDIENWIDMLDSISSAASIKERYAKRLEEKIDMIEMAKCLEPSIGKEFSVFIKEMYPEAIVVSYKGIVDGKIYLNTTKSLHYNYNSNYVIDNEGNKFRMGNPLIVTLEDVNTKTGAIKFSYNEKVVSRDKNNIQNVRRRK